MICKPNSTAKPSHLVRNIVNVINAYCIQKRLLVYYNGFLTLKMSKMVLNLFCVKTLHTEWHKKIATLLITNFQQIRDLIKLLSALMSTTFFLQQNVTNINDFDEGVLIPELFLSGNVILEICSFCIKSHVRSREEFL